MSVIVRVLKVICFSVYVIRLLVALPATIKRLEKCEQHAMLSQRLSFSRLILFFYHFTISIGTEFPKRRSIELNREITVATCFHQPEQNFVFVAVMEGTLRQVFAARVKTEAELVLTRVCLAYVFVPCSVTSKSIQITLHIKVITQSLISLIEQHSFW